MSSSTQDPSLFHFEPETIEQVVKAFLLDRQSQGLSPKTIRAYSLELRYFCEYLEGTRIALMDDMTADVIRRYLVVLAERRNPGGCHIAYRVIRTFTYWWEQETDDEYCSPIRKVKAPKLSREPLDPLPLEDFQALLNTCQKGTLLGDRDRAIFMALLDTGARAQEFLSLNLDDIDLVTGAVVIRYGKGNKSRTTYLGRKARRAIKAYLRQRKDRNKALWVLDEGDRMGYEALRDMFNRRSKRAGVKEPTPHSFRRAFALQCIRNGMDLLTVSRLLGHSNVSVTQRYIKQTDSDLERAHNLKGPVDNL